MPGPQVKAGLEPGVHCLKLSRGEGASRPLRPNPPTPAETKPSQAKPSQFKGRPVYLPSPPAESPEFPTLSVAKPTRSDPSRARPLFLTVSLSGTDTAKPSPNHFFQGDHVYESPPSLFRARNPLPRYLYLTQRVATDVHTVPSLHRHKQMPQKLYIAAGHWIRCVLPSQAKPV